MDTIEYTFRLVNLEIIRPDAKTPWGLKLMGGVGTSKKMGVEVVSYDIKICNDSVYLYILNHMKHI